MRKAFFVSSIFLLFALASCGVGNSAVCSTGEVVSSSPVSSTSSPASSSASSYPADFKVQRDIAVDQEGYIRQYGDEDAYRGKVHFLSGENKSIFTELLIPRGFDETRAQPLLILSHGFNAMTSVYDVYLSEIVPAGFACLRFDFCGGRLNTRSSGSMDSNMSIMTEVEDLRLITEYAKTLAFVDTSKIVLVGESQGGIVTALRAAASPDDYLAHIDLYPAYSIPDNVRKQFASLSDVPEHPVMLGTTVSKQYVSDIYTLDAYAEIVKFTKPVFLYHGDEDGIVPIAVSYKAQPLYTNATLTVLPGAGHGFGKESDKMRVADYILVDLHSLGL